MFVVNIRCRKNALRFQSRIFGKMKTMLLATAFAVLGSPMLAEGLSFGGEANAEYNADAAAMAVTVTPEANYALGAATFTLSSELSVYDSTATDSWTIAD